MPRAAAAPTCWNRPEWIACLNLPSANPKRCSKVSLTPRPEDPRDFEEFPRDEALAGFDPSFRWSARGSPSVGTSEEHR